MTGDRISIPAHDWACIVAKCRYRPRLVSVRSCQGGGMSEKSLGEVR